jgi:HPt (histidine-containing phosphotransfer) domain-containing protein
MTACATGEVVDGAAEATLPVIDPQALLERCMGEASAASAVLTMFHDRLPRLVAEIGASLVDPQARKATLSKVHNLKGNAGNLSADRLYRVASLLESALRREEFTDIPLLLQDLQREADALSCAIPAVLETLSR